MENVFASQSLPAASASPVSFCSEPEQDLQQEQQAVQRDLELNTTYEHMKCRLCKGTPYDILWPMKQVDVLVEGEEHIVGGCEPEGLGCQQCVDGCKIAMPYLSFSKAF